MEIVVSDLEQSQKYFILTSGLLSYLPGVLFSQNSKMPGPIPSMYFNRKQYKQTCFPLAHSLFFLSPTQLFYILDYESRQLEFY